MVEGDGEQVDWFDELVGEIREWHNTVLDASGGRSGENTARLLGACGRAFQGFGTEQFYPTEIDKAAALFHGIICDHAFVDGNKRTATMTAILFLVARGTIEPRPTNLMVRFLGDLAIETATPPHLGVEEIATWLSRIFCDLFPVVKDRD